MTPASLFQFEPTVRIGLCENEPFGLVPHGKYSVDAAENQVFYLPLHADSFMKVKGLEIGRGFHWSQRRDLRFPGVIRLERDNDRSRLLNIVKAEEYLKMVVGSEMNPLAPPELIKAHAIISRSWLMRQLMRGGKSQRQAADTNPFIRYTESDAHIGYDVCNDDHCQRYQGLDAVTETSSAAVEATRGIVLTDVSSGSITDARFSKCCGGKSEIYSTCWGDMDFESLQSVDDPYCAPDRLHRHDVSRLLKDYDALTDDYYRWRRVVPAALIAANIRNMFGVDVGGVISMKALRRGPSGRISLLKISGTDSEIEIGKELTIRRVFSDSHLYSSAFDIEKTDDGFTLTGHGWGHGVGLCQIGAAVMAAEGYSHEQILSHYYRNTQLSKLYD